MIAHAETAPPPPPRRYALARLACSRIDAGHDRVEAIADAIAAAIDGGHGLPPCYDRLTPTQRQVVLALWGNGPTRLEALIRALSRPRNTVWNLCKVLARSGILRRLRRGVYDLEPDPPPLRPLPGSHLLDRRLRSAIAQRGRATRAQLAADFGAPVHTMQKRLRRLCARGTVIRVSRGVYELATPHPASTSRP